MNTSFNYTLWINRRILRLKNKYPEFINDSNYKIVEERLFLFAPYYLTHTTTWIFKELQKEGIIQYPSNTISSSFES
jgi:hypothetical protein